MKKQRYDLNDLGSNVKMMRKARKISSSEIIGSPADVTAAI